jgi:hypothetical protein
LSPAVVAEDLLNLAETVPFDDATREVLEHAAALLDEHAREHAVGHLAGEVERLRNELWVANELLAALRAEGVRIPVVPERLASVRPLRGLE